MLKNLKKLFTLGPALLKAAAKAVVVKEIGKIQAKLDQSDTAERIEHQALEYLKTHIVAL